MVTDTHKEGSSVLKLSLKRGPNTIIKRKTHWKSLRPSPQIEELQIHRF